MGTAVDPALKTHMFFFKSVLDARNRLNDSDDGNLLPRGQWKRVTYVKRRARASGILLL